MKHLPLLLLVACDAPFVFVQPMAAGADASEVVNEECPALRVEVAATDQLESTAVFVERGRWLALHRAGGESTIVLTADTATQAGPAFPGLEFNVYDSTALDRDLWVTGSTNGDAIFGLFELTDRIWRELAQPKSPLFDIERTEQGAFYGVGHTLFTGAIEFLPADGRDWTTIVPTDGTLPASEIGAPALALDGNGFAYGVVGHGGGCPEDTPCVWVMNDDGDKAQAEMLVVPLAEVTDRVISLARLDDGQVVGGTLRGQLVWFDGTEMPTVRDSSFAGLAGCPCTPTIRRTDAIQMIAPYESGFAYANCLHFGVWLGENCNNRTLGDNPAYSGQRLYRLGDRKFLAIGVSNPFAILDLPLP